MYKLWSGSLSFLYIVQSLDPFCEPLFAGHRQELMVNMWIGRITLLTEIVVSAAQTHVMISANRHVAIIAEMRVGNVTDLNDFRVTGKKSDGEIEPI